ncbi:SCO family protein [Arenibaculum pallidiluteum]|uniref:SCO family protein n=1 Tax=Arenibaculum pallidiluteum TaxID=2812559 RepID=UPI001A975563|nr:SCO family protein [Arenibaculum pallidiluteum]
MKLRSILPLLAVAFVLVLSAIAVVATFGLGQRPGTTARDAGVADIGGPFRMLDQKGSAVTEADLLGKPTVIFFGFTFCPEVCPTTLHELTTAIQELGPDADRLNFVFVSVDPERDTPEQLALYLSAFDPRIRGFTGTQEQVDGIAKAYRVYHRRVPTGDGSYTMDHTATVYLMDADGRFSGTIAYAENRDTALGKLRRLAGLRA